MQGSGLRAQDRSSMYMWIPATYPNSQPSVLRQATAVPTDAAEAGRGLKLRVWGCRV